MAHEGLPACASCHSRRALSVPGVIRTRARGSGGHSSYPLSYGDSVKIFGADTHARGVPGTYLLEEVTMDTEHDGELDDWFEQNKERLRVEAWLSLPRHERWLPFDLPDMAGREN
jgi:hypothetical protein